MSDWSDIIAFADEHAGEEPLKMLLRQSRFPNVDMRLVAQQLEGRRQASEKWPSLLQCRDYRYPPKLNREQSSSEAAARYKAETLTKGGDRVADLTGGMGIDTMWMAKTAATVDYFEKEPALASLAQANFESLCLGNVICHPCDSLEWLEEHDRHFDLIYLDPARRTADGRKASAFEDCQPNLLDNLALLRSRCERLAVKASPMLSIPTALCQLDDVEHLYIIAVGGECKELLFVCRDGASSPTLHCTDLRGGERHDYSFTLTEERACEGHYASETEAYLYEPNAALMKGGAYKLISKWFGVKQLDPNTHLYTGDRAIKDFPGRQFKVLRELKLSRKEVTAAIGGRAAHVVTRNYPTAAAELQRQLGLREGGDLFVVATTVGGRKKGLLCERC